MSKSFLLTSAFSVLTLTLTACAGGQSTSDQTLSSADIAERMATLPAGDVEMNYQDWPKADIPTRAAEEAQIAEEVAALVAAMTVEEKVGQILQPEITNITPDEVREYNIGSVLNGGNGRPNRDVYASADDWLDLADAYYLASIDTSDGGVGIPIIWGTDSVHGNNSIFGGTIFPHNIGLGAANDKDLMVDIGRVTAIETAAMGTDWTFAPAVSVARNDTWGRTYEAYSEDPEIVAELGAGLVLGLQGSPENADDFFTPGSVIATAKHYIADGGTQDGRDQGDAVMSETELRDIHMPPYITTMDAGVQTIMASYSKWNGVRMHGHAPLIEGALKDVAGFNGFVVGDFNGHALIPGCTNWDCPEALLAGVDMYMIPADWKQLYENLVIQVNDGTIPIERLDDAVTRILTVKKRAGLFEAGMPSERPFAGADFIGTPEHLDVARRAARQSMVLLKNNESLLPLSPSSTVVVAGSGANDISMQVGGWSMNWQGTGLENSDFPTGASFYDGLSAALSDGGGEAVLSTNNNVDQNADVAVIVFGEKPYAEYQGDRESVLYKLSSQDEDLALMKAYQDAGIPVVGVFISGRPLWINPQLNASDAMVAAFLPGTEGGRALADLIVQDSESPAYDFTGRLSFSWPSDASQTELNYGDDDYNPLFPLGYGLSLSDDSQINSLTEDPGLSDTLLAAAESSVFFEEGRTLAPWRIYLGDAGEARQKTEGDRFVTSRTGAVRYESYDRNRQEDSKLVSWSGDGNAKVFVQGYSFVDFERRADSGEALILSANITVPAEGEVLIGFGRRNAVSTVDVSEELQSASAGEDIQVSVPLSCFVDDGTNPRRIDIPFEISTSDRFEMVMTDLRLGEPVGEVADCD